MGHSLRVELPVTNEWIQKSSDLVASTIDSAELDSKTVPRASSVGPIDMNDRSWNEEHRFKQ